ncbi:hypothetical protein [Sphingorhabdus sp. M41]|uniref:hypothetical protein n=1 Tax=Sphingorhabdus sp. M41 TaxID=1806885 RepID=UPI00078C0C52|nr:hypothetical protein [Sphingorhabdus sp. M41]AMO71627.1 hypothetical protein AZE99_06945 [Sphingorhabdus sp. M41]
MIPEPSLLMIAPMADDLDLARLPWSEAAAEHISVNPAKFKNLEMVEVIFDAMTFLVSRLTVSETHQHLVAKKCKPLSCAPPDVGESAIGVALGENLASAGNLPEVNRRLLLLGKWIGEGLNATAAAWLPSRRLTNFSQYARAVDQYVSDGRFPAFFQTSI